MAPRSTVDAPPAHPPEDPMTVETVRFYSHGAALAGTLKLPDGRSGDDRVPAVVQAGRDDRVAAAGAA